jgi:hypothetical protein
MSTSVVLRALLHFTVTSPLLDTLQSGQFPFKLAA